ncbi:MAG: zf-HC2 domain-containing protein [Chloroflexi bacterium]|nr:zf-HC2 domain-containing protein [Chloroflexota bacterium]
MSNHITEWLNAYMDGELKNGKLHQVEKHLAECGECRAELESLKGLSNLLHEVPAPEFTPSERFAAQVSLRLPHAKPGVTRSKAQEIGWWMIPVSLLLLWVFVGTTEVVSEMVLTANRLGLLSLNDAPTWLASDPSNEAVWSGQLGEFGFLSGNSLQYAERTEAFTRNNLPQIVWQSAIALLYLSWIAIWWARHTRRETDQLPEG